MTPLILFPISKSQLKKIINLIEFMSDQVTRLPTIINRYLGLDLFLMQDSVVRMKKIK